MTSIYILDLPLELWFMILGKMDYVSCVRLIKCTCTSLCSLSEDSVVKKIIKNNREKVTVGECSFHPYNQELTMIFHGKIASNYIRIESFSEADAIRMTAALIQLEKNLKPKPIHLQNTYTLACEETLSLKEKSFLSDPTPFGYGALQWKDGYLVYMPMFFIHGSKSMIVRVSLKKMKTILKEYSNAFHSTTQSLHIYSDGRVEKNVT